MSQPSGPPVDQVRVTVSVAVDPETAFQIFTEKIDQWWRRGVKFRASGKGPGVMRLEPEVGGRLFERIETGAGAREVETGRVTTWDPPSRLVFDWSSSGAALTSRWRRRRKLKCNSAPREAERRSHSRTEAGARSVWTTRHDTGWHPTSSANCSACGGRI